MRSRESPAVVGIGALNLDYIVDITAAAGADHEAIGRLAERLQARLAAAAQGFTWGGEASVDEDAVHAALEEIGGSAVEVALGGSAFNAICALARMELGLTLGFVGVAGRMPRYGLSCRQTFADWGIDDAMVRDDHRRLAGVCLSIAFGLDRTLCTHAGANVAMADYLDACHDQLVAYLAGSRLLHVTSLLDDRSPACLLRLLRSVREANPHITICLDPGHVWASHVTPTIEGIIALSDYLLLNHREFTALGGGPCSDDELAGRVLERFGGRRGVVVVKRRYGIANFHLQNGKVCRSMVAPHEDAPPLGPDEIKDATGAGDVFAAGVLAALASDRLRIELGSVLGMALARHKLRYVGTSGHGDFAEITRDVIRAFGPRASHQVDADGVFVAHGRSDQWRVLKEFLDRECRLPVVAFDGGLWSGKPVTDALLRYQEQCSLAVCVLTAEDSHGAREWARQNVVHEVGLFQGRFGEGRVILLVEEGCGFVPEAPEEQVLRYGRGEIDSTLWRVRRLIGEQFPGAFDDPPRGQLP